MHLRLRPAEHEAGDFRKILLSLTRTFSPAPAFDIWRSRIAPTWRSLAAVMDRRILENGGWTRRSFLLLLSAVALGGMAWSPCRADAAPKKIELKSSVLAWAAYDEEAKTLEVEFRSGEVYRYAKVPAEVFQGLMKAESKGRYFSQRIRNRFPAEHVRRQPAPQG